MRRSSHRGYPGARSTPTVDGKLLYVTGGAGAVTCHRISDGRKVWSKNMRSDMGGRVGGWKYAESVLILGDLAIVTPGGSNCIVALDKNSGRSAVRLVHLRDTRRHDDDRGRHVQGSRSGRRQERLVGNSLKCGFVR